MDQFLHVIGRIGIVGDQRIKAFLDTARLIKERAHGRLFAVVERQEIHQTAHFGQGLYVVLERAIGDA